jgi:hypothetical protein
MRGHRYVYNRLYRWDLATGEVAQRRPWKAECTCSADWVSFHKTWRSAWNAAYRHHCPIVITIG